MKLNFWGILLGIMSFATIGIWHPIVIKGEYYLGRKKCTVIFAVIGAVCTVAAVLVDSLMLSSVIAIFGFSAFWGIGEVKEQEQRVARGWFPKNENRK